MFIALEVSLSWNRSLRPIIAAIRRHEPDLAEQLSESSSSVPLNLAEGSKRRGRDMVNRYRIADGSLFESRTNVRLAGARGYLDGMDTREHDELADRAAALVHRLIHPRRR